jgi:predicted acylesterase/phospholipase RssA
VFGADENNEVTIAQAMQASTALPLFYKPARLNGVDYVDGGVRNTANIDVAIEKGADLIVCYNPFRPFLNKTDEESVDPAYFADGRYLSDRGLKLVLNQVFRTLLHSRLKLGLQRYLNDDRFRGDIVLLEPREHDLHFFSVNPMAFWKRGEAVRHGFESVRDTIERNYTQLREVFDQYGIEMDREAALGRAREMREQRGWDAVEGVASEGVDRALRLVGA